MTGQFSMATIPLPSMEGTPECVPIFPPRMSGLLGKRLWELELSVRREGCPTVSEAALVSKTVAGLGFLGGVWDKKLTRNESRVPAKDVS